MSALLPKRLIVSAPLARSTAPFVGRKMIGGNCPYCNAPSRPANHFLLSLTLQSDRARATDVLLPADAESLPDHVYHVFQIANALRRSAVHAPESPVVREADQEPSRHRRSGHREFSPTRERRQPLGEALHE